MNDRSTILAVDDTPESLALLAKILTPAGYDVRPADSGELALAAAAADPPDLILLDVIMQDLDGLEVCRRLKANEETRHIPVILISPFADAKDWVEGLRLGAVDYITKPFQSEELQTLVQTHLAMRRTSVSLEQQTASLQQANERLRSEIAERRKAQEAIRVLTLRQEVLLSYIPEVVMEVDDAMVYTWANKAGYEFYGEDVIGREAAVYFEGAQDTCQTMNPLFEGGDKVIYVESWQRRKDGQKRLLAWWCRALKDEQGRVLGALSSARDITEQQTAKNDLKASETQYRRLFEAARDGILILDATTGQIVDVNPFLMELTGYSHTEFLDKHIWEIGLFKDIVASKDQFALLQTTEYVRYEDLPLETHDGQRIEVEFVSNVYLVDDLKVIQCNIRDITERVLSAHKLALAKAFLDNVINAIADPIFVKDDQRKFVLVNDALCEIVGRSRDELMGRDGDDMFPPEQVAVFRDMDNRVIETGEENSNEESISNLDSGEVRTIVTRKTLYTDPTEGRFLVGVIRDITENMRAKEELQKMLVLKAKTQRLESVGTLAAGVAHEINNPLNIMMNYAQLILDDEATKGEPAEYAKSIVKEGKRVASIVKNLLAFSRQEKETHSPADIDTLVHATLSLIGASFRRDQIALDVAIPKGLPKVRCRSQQIQQVLLNLLTNARDALNERFPGAAPEKRIRVTARPFEQAGMAWIRMTVQDRGGGIPPEVGEHMFDPFFTTKAREKGTGLGLSISHGIMGEHHGNLWFESELGTGTRFHMDLRVNKSEALPQQTRQREAEEVE